MRRNLPMEKNLAKNTVEGLEKIDYNIISTKEKESIQKKTYIANALDVAEGKEKYNAQVKKILSDKNILAWILKYTTKEFTVYSIEEIKESIEDTPEVSCVPVYPGRKKPEAITGMNTSNQIPNEGEVTYDILFHAFTRDMERIKLIINIEAQKKYHVGYDLVTRGIFYCARMLSAQLDTEFSNSDYDQIKKVYSIWICMDTPKYAANTLTEYTMAKNDLFGNFKGNARYDLLSVVMVCLGDESKIATDNSQKTKLHSLLSTLLSKKLTLEEKEVLLNNEYGIVTQQGLKEEMRDMCNLADLVEERGIEHGIQKEKINIILNMIKKGMSNEDICSLVECSQEFVEGIRKKAH